MSLGARHTIKIVNEQLSIWRMRIKTKIGGKKQNQTQNKPKDAWFV